MAINYFKRSRERYQEMSAKQTQRLCVIVVSASLCSSSSIPAIKLTCLVLSS